MKVGISTGYSGARMDMPIRRIQRAEALGFDSVGVPKPMAQMR